MVGHPLLTRKAIGLAVLAAAVLAVGLNAQKFYDDDPISKDPPPLDVGKIKGRKLSDLYDYFHNTFKKPGERQGKGQLIPARAVNTLGEVPDGEWYTNRHYWKPMSIEELVRGAGNANAPDMSEPLTVIAAKTEGISPGFTMRDARGRKYFVKFDPKTNPEMATAADVIGAKFYYALGYSVPENYIFNFRRGQLVVAPDASFTDSVGKRRPMAERDVVDLLVDVPRLADGSYRAVASFSLPGTPIGPFRYYGTRSDDPNDVVPHEHRRDLRGLRVFSAWLAHEDTKALNTLDTLIEENGKKFVQHNLIDFGTALGSQAIGPKSPLWGNEYLFTWSSAAAQFFSLGLYVPRWARAKYPKIPAVGRFEAEVFDPERWVPHYYNSAFSNCLPDDAFWAAKQVMALSDEQIHAMVKTGEFSDPRAAQWIADCLITRRDKIGRTYFAKLLPLDRFAVQDDKLVFEDLEVKHRIVASRDYQVEWFRFDNQSGQKVPLTLDRTLALPQALKTAAPGEYYGAHIRADDPKKLVTVYLRKGSGEIEVVGVDRTW